MYTKKMNLTETLSHQMPLALGADKRDAFGVELEVEGRKLYDAGFDVLTWWAQTKDGSLRQLTPGAESTEYLFRQPLDYKQTEKAISILFGYLNSPGVVVFDSYRTSLHVHVNYSQEQFRTIYNAMTLSLILDELLVSQNGEHRVGNNFCLRAKDAMGQVVSLIASIQQGYNWTNVGANNRYCSINFASLLKFGTIEYRSMECTTHEGRVMHWIGTLQQIKERARTFKNPTEIISQFSQFDPKDFLAMTLGPYALKYLKVDGYENMLRNGMRIAQDLAYCSAWTEKVPTEAKEGS